MLKMSVNLSEKPILWGVRASPFVRKVQIALKEKNLIYQHNEILPKILLAATQQEVPLEFERVSPLGKIPALSIGEFCVADSAVICAFLDKQYDSGNKIFPENIFSYTRALWFENYADNIFANIAYKKIFAEAVIKPKVLNLEPDSAIINKAWLQELPLCLDYLEKEVDKFEWLAGDQFSIADIALITHFIALHQSGFYIDQPQWKKLSRYISRTLAHPSVSSVILEK